MTMQPLFQVSAPSRAGRPRGAKSAVFAQARTLGIHHFAFMRSTLLGLDPKVAFERYLAWSETTTDLRHVQHRRGELLKEILDAGARVDAGRPPNAKITHHLVALADQASDARTVQLPSLDEWMAAEGMDPDAWSEAEALAEYRAAHGIDNLDQVEAHDVTAPRRDPVQTRVDALNHLQTLLATVPSPKDRVDGWFAPAVVARLRTVGIVTLNDLVSFINVYGHRWFDRVKGFGQRRADRVVAWLRSQQEALQLELRASVDEGSQVRALRLGVDPGRLTVGMRFGLVPLEQLSLPPSLLGMDGVFRSRMPNTLEADNDLQAIRAWLSRYNERPSTWRSYRKEIERFVLWTTTVQRKPVSSVSALDCQAYRAFLASVPAHWIHPVPVQRTDPAWRPFRGQLEPSAQKQALVIVQTMFEGLCDAGYMLANPMRAVMKGFKLPKTRLNISRSFSEAEWGHVLRCLAELPANARGRRRRCMLELLVSSGIRLDELAKARRADLRLESLPGLPDTWVLTVTGKRDKQREVPLADYVVALLDEHARDFAEEDQAQIDPGSLPLVRGLEASVQQWRRSEADGSLHKASITEQGGDALSAAGIYGVVKRFMKAAAKTAAAAGLDKARFESASTHWMRHTFVRQSLVDGMALELASELVGHASIDTTSIYSTQELARKINAVRIKQRRAHLPID